MGARAERITGDNWRPVQGIIKGDADAVAYLSATYRLPADIELFKLVEGIRGRGTEDNVEDWSEKRFMELREDTHPLDSDPDTTAEGPKIVIGCEQDRQKITEKRGFTLSPGQGPNEIMSPAQCSQALRELARHVRRA